MSLLDALKKTKGSADDVVEEEADAAVESAEEHAEDVLNDRPEPPEPPKDENGNPMAPPECDLPPEAENKTAGESLADLAGAAAEEV